MNGHTRASRGRVRGALVAHGVELSDPEMMAVPANLRGPIGVPIPANVGFDG